MQSKEKKETTSKVVVKKNESKSMALPLPTNVVVKKKTNVSRVMTLQSIQPKNKKVRRAVYWSVVIFVITLFFASTFVVDAIWPGSVVSEYLVFNILDGYSENENFLHRLLRAIYLTFIVLLAMKVFWIALKIIGRGGTNRRRTILALIQSFGKYTGIIVILFVVLSVFGVSAAALLAGAGIIGIVIAFGAQSLLTDIIAGLFIVFENSFEVGDIITFNGMRGTVEHIGIRTTKIKAVDGNVHVINNSELRVLTNMTQNRSLAISDVTIEYTENLEKVEKIIRASLEAITQKITGAKEEVRYLGVAEFTPSGLTLRLVVQCNEADRMQVSRDLNRELKLLFDKNNIKFGVPNVKVSGR